MNVRPLSFLGLVPAFLLLTVCAALSQSEQASPPEARPALEVQAPAGSPLPAGIDKALEKVLDRKLAPIMRALAEMQEQKIRLTDVLGGLGYICGLVGVAAYFKRKP
jgi:nickel transport protein